MVLALLSNIPFGVALRASEVPSDTTCYFTNGKLNTASASFRFIVEEGTMPRTQYVVCPDFGEDDDDQHRTFTSEFSGHPNALASYYVPGQMMEHDIQTMKLYEFKAPPPNDTGLDPLAKIIQLPPEMLWDRLDWAATVWEIKFDRFNGDERACLATMAIIQQLHYHTFKAFCDAYRNISNSAVEAASNQTWHFWDKGEEHIEVFPPLGNLDGMSEQEKFIALAHPIYH
ncbi:hypothetical protein FOZ61_006407 [Perkinsus olseni]|uniref:Uncharacterized protein n=1 Tax=Perkinsus olseni TaxID=32597 RepID=A0A7J6LDQ1_PEROL|nr:hypothetical protein FOZ61_006407 [Perkinsus olseni]KAF4661062.1 hypothetical protein FOL46_005871 [Perkinsus olseni]